MNNTDTFSRLDLAHIAGMIPEGATVLDVGCGDGDLLALLRDTRDVHGRGLEISREGVSACVAKGLSVVQGNADDDLKEYPTHAFDYIILTRTIQAMNRPDLAIQEALRVGKRVIVSFPNFGFWKVRARLLLNGRMPQSRALPMEWYDTPNIHLCTIRDFVALCQAVDNVEINRAYAASTGQTPSAFAVSGLALAKTNLLAEEAIFELGSSA
jgi:methionine biosynthesis protein MetW